MVKHLAPEEYLKLAKERAEEKMREKAAKDVESIKGYIDGKYSSNTLIMKKK